MFRLTKQLNGRPITVLLHGKSLRLLTGYPDSYIATVNDWTLIEDFTDCRVDLVALCSETEMLRLHDPLLQYLDRGGLLLTTQEALAMRSDTGTLIPRFRNQIICTQKPLPVTQSGITAAPNTATILLDALIRAGAQEIHIWGMDGSTETTERTAKKTYFDDQLFVDPRRSTEITRDTTVFNAHFPTVWQKAAEESGNHCRIVNHSDQTHITAIPLADNDSLPYIENT